MDTVPVLQVDELLKKRFEKLINHFESRFHYKPDFFTRVPGRVNLIGDHVDYSGYSVCPMAIEHDVLLAVGKPHSSSSGLHLTNVESHKYPDYICDNFLSCREELINNKQPHWYKYFICGVVGAMEEIPKKKFKTRLDVAVWGNIPPAAGLSSSSALVSSAVLAVSYAFEYPMSKNDLALLSSQAERHIGTQGGAMDQAIAFLAKAGAAKLIEFNPLRTIDVKLPDEAVFVIANSMVEFNKAATTEFNTRVHECKSAANLIAKQKLDHWEDVKTIGELQKCLGTNFDETLKIAEQILSVEHPVFMKRCQHVLQEAARVLEFQRVCQSSNVNQLNHLGELMNLSHESLRYLYECSHESVDLLVEMALKLGALGARLTGAGWGGCVVILTTKDKVDQLINDLKQIIRNLHGLSEEDQLDKIIFTTEPHQGAAIYES
ncbi:N-acetylgalactosamine kinase [Chelonus insularis]|uniref:N-acetylgalactosamine kinase n=1 Tax=Chelonus insularis TaxID=460826 RepID=UPI00158CCA6F|nr:N-acetylgalactosamine kinase-like [Chelonus insularis]